MFRLLHSADWHLGQTLHGFDRNAEQEAALEALLNIIEEQSVDAVILAGDVYHVANPPVHAQKLFFHFIKELQRRTPTVELVVIAGNHDSGARLELPQSLGLGDRVRILGAPPRGPNGPDPAASVLALHDKSGAPRAALIAQPYPRPGDLHSADKVPQEQELKNFLRSAASFAEGMFPDLTLIVSSHLHVRGGQTSHESERTILVGGEEAVPLSDFPEAAAYIALGHLHRPQQLKGAPTAVYSGPLIPLSSDEARFRQSICIVDLPESPKLPATYRRITIPRTRDFLFAPAQGAASLETVENELSDLAKRLKEDPEAQRAPPFLEVSVALDGPAPDLRRRIEAALDDAPVRLTRIRRVVPGATDALNAPPEETPAPPSPEGAFAELYELRYGAPPPDELRRAFQALLQSAQQADPSSATTKDGA